MKTIAMKTIHVADDAFNEKVAFNCLLSRKRRVTENGFEYELKDSGYLQTVTPASVDVMSTVALHNVLRWKPRDSYTSKVDEVQSNGS